MSGKLSVLFTTHNGARWIGRVLEAYEQQAYDQSWELVIADNASRDQTVGIIKSFGARLPIVLVQAPQLGQNRARNAALTHVTGELVVMSDDDAVPHAHFLAGWATLLTQNKHADIFGGRIEPVFDFSPEKWVVRLARVSNAAFAKRDLQPGPLAAREIFSPNMAIRRRVFEAGHRFDERIGPNASDPNYPTGSETEFLTRMERAGFRAEYIAGPTVSHIVRANQATLEQFKSQARRAGRGHAMRARIAKEPLLTEFARDHVIKRLVPAFMHTSLLHARALVAVDPVVRVQRWWAYCWWQGYMDEVRGAQIAQPDEHRLSST